MSLKTILSLLSLAAIPLAAAVPAPSSNAGAEVDSPEVSIRRKLPLGTAIGGALDLPPTPTEAPSPELVAQAVSRLTITMENKNGGDVSTVHVRAANAPPPVSGNTSPGRMKDGQKSVFVVKAGWSGNIAVSNAQYKPVTGDESLIEGSFVNQFGRHQGDLDVSYVNGFSVPLVCYCNQNKLIVGCNKNLFELGRCPNPNGQGSCKNPHRSGPNSAAPFFKPCHGKGGAYTYPGDNDANQLNARCPQEQYTCCIGRNCPKSPK
ncbi:hypothetical protein QQS21_002791 [Conoideocrella luteorostrata]|uniref:Thaumatin-like protein n=1 Tax=Conoideocrella luteorostrata TaxID=1105319 RepID=A0AAJ0CXC9_9HYPO|nr:hypothetical protein QQS21_002791 [Conoideocrella luteorostrata]